MSNLSRNQLSILVGLGLGAFAIITLLFAATAVLLVTRQDRVPVANASASVQSEVVESLVNTPTPRPSPTPVKQKATIIPLYGMNDSVEFINIPEATEAMVNIYYSGDSNFSITCDKCNSLNYLWVNTIGAYDGTIMVEFDRPGQYALEIKAEGRNENGYWQMLVTTTGEIDEQEVKRTINKLTEDTTALMRKNGVKK